MYVPITEISQEIYTCSIPGKIYLKNPWKCILKLKYPMKVFTWTTCGNIYLKYVSLYILYLPEVSLEKFTWSIPGNIYLKYPWKYLREVSLEIFTWSIPDNFYLKCPWKYLPEVFLDKFTCISLEIFNWRIPGNV